MKKNMGIRRDNDTKYFEFDETYIIKNMRMGQIISIKPNNTVVGSTARILVMEAQ